MNSPTERLNIIQKKFTELGVTDIKLTMDYESVVEGKLRPNQIERIKADVADCLEAHLKGCYVALPPMNDRYLAVGEGDGYP